MSIEDRATLFGRLGRDVAVYALGDLAVRATGFLLVPLYTRRLTLAAFGVLGLIQILETGLGLLLNMGFPTAIMRRVGRGGEGVREDVFSALLVLLGVTALSLGALATAAFPVARSMFGDDLEPALLRWVFLGIFFATLKLFVISLLRAEGRSVAYVLFNLTHFVAIMALNLLLVAGLGLGLRGAILANATATGLVCVSMLPVLARRIRPAWRGSAVGALLTYGLPLMPGMIAMWVVTMSNRWFIQHYRGVAEVGLYTLGFRLAMVLQIALVTPFRTAWLPIMFSLRGRPDAHRACSLVLTYFVGIAAFGALALALLAPEAVALLAPAEYAGAARVAPLLALGYLLYGIYFVVDNGVLLGGRTATYPLVTGTAAAVSIALNFVLVPEMGIVGAAGSTAISYLILVVLMYRASARTYPIPYELGRAAVPCAVGGLLYAVGTLGSTALASRSVPLKLLCLCSYPALLYAAGYFREPERRRIAALFRLRRVP